MGKKRQSAVNYRHCISVPDNDIDVVNWINAQNNLSMSVRQLIKQSVQKDGIGDIFCKQISNPGVSAGRPKGSVSVTENVAETKTDVTPKMVEPVGVPYVAPAQQTVPQSQPIVQQAPVQTPTPQASNPNLNPALASLL